MSEAEQSFDVVEKLWNTLTAKIPEAERAHSKKADFMMGLFAACQSVNFYLKEEIVGPNEVPVVLEIMADQARAWLDNMYAQKEKITEI